MTESLWTLFLSVGAVTAAALGYLLLARSPVSVAVVTALYVLIASDIPHVPPIMSISGTSVYFLDYFTVALFISSLPRLWRRFSASPAFIACWGAMLGVLVASLLRGMGDNGLGAAVNDFRSFLYVIATAQWALSLNWTAARTRALIERGGQLLGWALVGVFAIHVASRGLGGADQLIVNSVTGELSTSRPLNSGQALVLLLCAITSFSSWLHSNRPAPLLASMTFFACVALAQNRSTWAAAAGALVVLVMTSRLTGRVRLLAVAVCCTLGGWILVLSGFFGDVAMQLSGSLSSSSTYDAREDSWRVLVEQLFSSGDPLRILFGSPMGDGYARVESTGRLVEYAPHNWYVSVLLRAGILGVTLLIVMMSSLLIRALKARDSSVGAIVAAVLLFGWAYSWPWYAMIHLGWSASHVRAPAPSPHRVSGGARARPPVSPQPAHLTPTSGE